MIIEKVFSTIYDKDIRKNLQNSVIWKDCYKDEEEKPNLPLYLYRIKFNGLKPVQVLNIKKI